MAATVYAPKDLENFKEDLKAMHGIMEICFFEPTEEVKAKARRLSGDVFVVE